MKRYFNRLKDNGKPGKTGVIALERKLLVLIYTLYKNDQDYIIGYQTGTGIDNTDSGETD